MNGTGVVRISTKQIVLYILIVLVGVIIFLHVLLEFGSM